MSPISAKKVARPERPKYSFHHDPDRIPSLDPPGSDESDCSARPRKRDPTSLKKGRGPPRKKTKLCHAKGKSDSKTPKCASGQISPSTLQSFRRISSSDDEPSPKAVGIPGLKHRGSAASKPETSKEDSSSSEPVRKPGRLHSPDSRKRRGSELSPTTQPWLQSRDRSPRNSPTPKIKRKRKHSPSLQSHSSSDEFASSKTPRPIQQYPPTRLSHKRPPSVAPSTHTPSDPWRNKYDRIKSHTRSRRSNPNPDDFVSLPYYSKRQLRDWAAQDNDPENGFIDQSGVKKTFISREEFWRRRNGERRKKSWKDDLLPAEESGETRVESEGDDGDHEGDGEA